jgi:hypothetical protein
MHEVSLSIFSQDSQEVMCPSKDGCSSRIERSRRILAQCIKRLGEWMHYPSYSGPDHSLLFIGSHSRFSRFPTPPWGTGIERGNVD